MPGGDVRSVRHDVRNRRRVEDIDERQRDNREHRQRRRLGPEGAPLAAARRTEHSPPRARGRFGRRPAAGNRWIDDDIQEEHKERRMLLLSERQNHKGSRVSAVRAVRPRQRFPTGCQFSRYPLRLIEC